MKAAYLALLMLAPAACGPIEEQAKRDDRQSDMNAVGEATGCPPGETYYPGAGSPWYVEPTPGGCSKD